MRNCLLSLLIVVSLVCTAFAQSQSDSAKFEIIRETINFLATDKVVSADTTFRITCDVLDYDCFRRELSSEPIAGIVRWFDSWRNMAASNEAGPVALRDKIFADIFNRPGKGYRKQLPHYETYITRVDQLINPPAPESPLDEVSMDPIEEVPPIYLAPEEEYINTPEVEENAQPMIAYFALACSLLALLLVARLVFRKKEVEASNAFLDLSERLDDLSMRLQRLENKLLDNQLKGEAVATLTEIMESVERRVVELEKAAGNH